MTALLLVAASLPVWMLGANGERDSAARRELRGHDRLVGRACFYEIVENAVCHCFVKGALIPIRSQIKFEGFTFDAETVGHVIDIDPGKIRLTCDWTNRSEIVRFEMNPVIAARRRIWESLEPRLGRRGGQSRFTSSEKS
jgi:hypothetical protein